MPKIDTLVQDIQDLINGKKPLTEGFDEIMLGMGREIGLGLASRLSETQARTSPSSSSRSKPFPFRLRVSNHGKPLRALWYESQGFPTRPFPPNIAILGDLAETLVLALAQAAGHEVTLRQAEVDVGGIVGHIDAVIDGELVDVKSTSDHGFIKFKNGLTEGNDTYVYRRQLSDYAESQGRPHAYFLVVNKTKLDMVLVKQETLPDTEDYIWQVESALSCPEPPPRCFPDEEKTKDGNRALCSTCKWCDFKFECWKDANDGQGLRVFDYARSPEFFTAVVKRPTRNVTGKGTVEIEEITDRYAEPDTQGEIE